MKRSFIMVVSLVLTLTFAWMYIQLFVKEVALSAGKESALVYYLQVGVFSNYENAQRRIADLQEDAIDAQMYEKEQQYYVVTGMSTDEATREVVQKKLDLNGYGSYEKQILVQDRDVITKMENQSYDSLLEVMRLSK